jgi:hypothetical protein
MTTFTTEDRITANEPPVPPKVGSRWYADDIRQVFHVLHTIELEGHTWVHYIKDKTTDINEIREYSCYLESFLTRFRALPE